MKRIYTIGLFTALASSAIILNPAEGAPTVDQPGFVIEPFVTSIPSPFAITFGEGGAFGNDLYRNKSDTKQQDGICILYGRHIRIRVFNHCSWGNISTSD